MNQTNRSFIYKHTIIFLSLFLLLVSSAQAQEPTILKGKVIESRTKTPLTGASISLKGSTNAVTTDNKGEFKLETYKKLPVYLTVSFVGYQAQEITISDNSFVNIELVEQSNQLADVVVLGYGTQKRKDVTGSVATVSKDLLTRPVTSFDNLLQGSVAGVVVTQSSGQPGATSSIRIRGGNSLSFGNDPLYVIDGFIYYNDNSLVNFASPSAVIPSVTGVSTNGISTINPYDIESIDILKDASATAIYGSRGANGVVIITTKRGTKGSNNINYSASYGIQDATKTLSLLNGPQWAKYFDDLYAATPSLQPSNSGPGLSVSKLLIDSLGNAGVNGDWVGSALRQGATQNHQLTLYGGDEKSRYSISGNYFDQKGIVTATDFKRYSAKVNYEKNYSKDFKVNVSILGSNSIEDKLVGTAYNSINFNTAAFPGLYLFNPLQAVTNKDGSYNVSYQPSIAPTLYTVNGQQFSVNPLQDINSITNQVNLGRVLGNLSGEYKITKDLTFKTTFGADQLNTKLNYYTPSYTSLGSNGGTYKGVGSVTNINTLTWLNENTFSYNHSINDKHFFDVLAGYTTQYLRSVYAFAGGYNFPNDITAYNNLNLASNPGAASGESKSIINSWLGRVSYSFKHKYNLTLTGRADGASVAGLNKKWGFFPSAGFSWNASDEDFFKPLSKTINNLKVRLTAGSVGNANFPAYSSLGLEGFNGYYYGSPLSANIGLAPTQLSNPDLTWETTAQYDAGVDIGFLNNRITLTADYYYKKTTNLYISGSGLVPLSTGYASVSENIGSLENKGLELSLSTENIKTKDFSWKSTLIYASNSNKVLSLGPNPAIFPVAPTGQVSPVIVKVGLPVGTFWGYKTDGLLTTDDVYGANPAAKLSGVSQQTGDRKYLHAPGVTGATITTADKQNLGSAQPDFTASFNNTLTYKNFDLSFFFQASVGGKLFNLIQQQLEKTTTTGNVSATLLDRWDSVNNPNGKTPKVTNAPVVQVSDVYIEDGSYLRLKNITFGYNFPKSVAHKILAKQLRLYVSAQNLLTITNYSGLDPEANFYDQNNLQPGIDYGVYPNARTYTIGLNVTF
ncbi:SusC/RagA family TonB-linked outer membrane protein [Ferruginibacter albus]|uniref:SusC/RagA family TonB-linked outer membrane protein n=1 Tax=Ferruginibacter albus TaxID=2875540 RepID=UPI001CC82B92|nr:TonB-dependent receptor [Ferruginibacter albus]UAY52041.1 TonB-dependent receptor [Ferruginibacter albus]